ncbi:hypothetical protein JVV04_20630, partial [Vibrio cholerae O1]|nr:hypothetical protein [Vibrio cholerae O1]
FPQSFHSATASGVWPISRISRGARFCQKVVKVKVENLRESTKKEDAAGMYTMISETRVNE